MNFVKDLDEYFCSRFADYVRIAAIQGYCMPEILYVAPDGNIAHRDRALMKLIYQENREELLRRFKDGLADTEFSFGFSFRPLRDKIKDPFRKYTFAKLLPKALARSGETAEAAGERLDIAPKYWKGIVKGKLYPQKNLIFALALTSRLSMEDTNLLLAVSGFSFEDTCVRDIVVEYLLSQKVFNPEMQQISLEEYAVELPIKAI